MPPNEKNFETERTLVNLAGRSYSILNACVGSIRQARKAGAILASSAVRIRLAIMAAKTAGSTGCVP